MNTGEIIALVSVATTVITAVIGILLWVVKTQVTSMQREFKPNGGSSVRDTLNEIRADVREVRGKVDGHIDWHLEE